MNKQVRLYASPCLPAFVWSCILTQIDTPRSTYICLVLVYWKAKKSSSELMFRALSGFTASVQTFYIIQFGSLDSYAEFCPYTEFSHHLLSDSPEGMWQAGRENFPKSGAEVFVQMEVPSVYRAT